MASPEEITRQLIEKLAPGDGPAQDVMAVWGFLKESATDKNSWRLYLNIEFTEYLEFHKEYYVHHQILATEQNPLGGMMVWVQRNADIRYTNTQPQVREAGFLQGNIAGTLMPQVGPQGIPGAFAGGFRPGAQRGPASPGCSGMSGCGLPLSPTNTPCPPYCS
jgi:hypothetical protein